ncbi:MAG: hypothetical protein E6Q67_01700 [Roseateles sp.]|nr:MAG: hypothetical protein E6Q67_01700 [Roseateles sp.]
MSKHAGTQGAEAPRLTVEVFNHLIAMLGDQALNDINWSENVEPPTDAEAFAREAIFVITHGGMAARIAIQIFRRCMQALQEGVEVSSVFGHRGKAAAIERIWRERAALFVGFKAADDKLQFLRDLPFIGQVTVYHLAKNLCVGDYAKPDLHLVRLAEREGTSAQLLCERLAKETGYRAATVDTVLWRACERGVIDSTSGAIPSLVA